MFKKLKRDCYKIVFMTTMYCSAKEDIKTHFRVKDFNFLEDFKQLCTIAHLFQGIDSLNKMRGFCPHWYL